MRLKSGAGLLVFAATAGITLLFWLLAWRGWGANAQTDYVQFYYPAAHNLLAGNGLVTATQNPATGYPPGYPLLLAALFWLSQLLATSETLCLQVFTLISVGAACSLLYLTARLIVDERAALLTAGLWMTYPLNLWLTKQPNSEIPFLPLLYGAIFLVGQLLWGKKRPALAVAFSAGLLFGLASLVRPIALVLGPLVAALILLLRFRAGRRWWLLAGLVVFGNLAAVIPWEVWAHRKTNAWIPLSTGGPQSMSDGLTFGVVTKGYRSPFDLKPEVKDIMTAAAALQARGELGSSREIFAFEAEAFRKHPAAATRLALWKASRAWYGLDTHGRGEAPLALMQAVLVLLSLSGAILLWRNGTTGREWVILAASITLYFWAMTTVALSVARYMTPAMALLMPSGALVIRKAASRWKGFVFLNTLIGERPPISSWSLGARDE